MKVFGFCIHFAREEGWWSLYVHNEEGEDKDEWTFFRALTWNTDPKTYTLSEKGWVRIFCNLYWEV